MNERMEANIICCAKLAVGDTPMDKATSFVCNLRVTTGLTMEGIRNNKVIMCIHGGLSEHGNIAAALTKAGL